MAESIVFGTATAILKKIGSLVGGELSLLWHLDSDLRRLQRTMSAIKAVLLDAETKQTQNHQLRDWLAKLKEVFYDAEDVLDEFDFQASRRSQRGSSTLKVSKYFSRSNPVKIGHKIKQIKERLDEIADDRRNFPFLLIESHVDVRHVIPKERETNSFFQASDKLETLRLFGCDGIKKLPKKIQRMISLRHVEITTKEWYLREDGIGCLSSLKFLTLSGCRNLVRLFEGMQGLTNLRRLVLQICPLTSLPYSIKYLKRLETVMIIDCVNLNLKMEFQGEDKDNLCLGVRKFIISRLPSLVDLPQLILQGSANTLQCIMIQSCLNLVELPEWLPNLTSLQTLEILNCPMLSCLPEGVQRLTDLRQLKIQGCPALSESCRRDESKIAHVREVHLDE
ncbi:hypothetical protein Pint_16962 [Pistacia integerrima]|uniref:Uncharacterized protein n=1 Tax=Pistacia integerrima TaxID=434235 RepID=A0ACC0ZFL9_9ROSI|nr:hypothetical protein Pint_16962 [Pistacia integerrima]